MASRLGGGEVPWEVDGPEDDGFGTAVGSCEEAWMSAARPCTLSRTCLLAPVSAGVWLPSELCRCSCRDEEAKWKDLGRAAMDSAEALNIGNLNVAAHENRDQV